MSRHHDNGRHDTYQIVPFPKLRRVLAIMYPAVQRAHKTRGLIEVDVTDARRFLRDYEAKTGDTLSFTAFIVACLARAVDENKSLNACRKGRKQLALFDDVDVAIPIERDMEGRKQPIIYSVRGANRKGVREITHEIRATQVAAIAATWEGFQMERWLMRTPMIVLRGLWAIFGGRGGAIPACKNAMAGRLVSQRWACSRRAAAGRFPSTTTRST